MRLESLWQGTPRGDNALQSIRYTNSTWGTQVFIMMAKIHLLSLHVTRVLVCSWLLCGTTSLIAQDTSVAGSDEVAEFMKKYAPRGVMSDGSQPTPPEVAVTAFDMHPGMQIELMASEPTISQPLFLSWDSRGRMWVVQYRQYQFPQV
ncbi:MAG: hypothetical protein R3C53_18790 [Pirellulaceae bacterium]